MDTNKIQFSIPIDLLKEFGQEPRFVVIGEHTPGIPFTSDMLKNEELRNEIINQEELELVLVPKVLLTEEK